MAKIILILLIFIFPIISASNKTPEILKTTPSVSNEVIIPQNDLLLLTKVVNSESHGESVFDKLLVASVVINRVNNENFPNSIIEVIYQPNQFSGIDTHLFRYNENNRWDKESYDAAKFVLTHGPINDEIIFFLNPVISTNRGWVETVAKRELIFKEKNHWFYK